MLKYTARALFNSISIRTNVSRVSHEIEINGFHCGVTFVLYFHLLSPVFFYGKGDKFNKSRNLLSATNKNRFQENVFNMFQKKFVMHILVHVCIDK